MTRAELKETTGIYDSNGEFVGYFIAESELDEIAIDLNLTRGDDKERYDSSKVEDYFNISLTYVDNPYAAFSEVEIDFS